MSSPVTRIQVIDTHTGGEPTRVIIAGGPDLGDGPMPSRREIFQRDFDHVRRAIILEPRGSDCLVGALLCAPTDPACAAGVIFFNNVGFLGMCGHGTIGVAVTLADLGQIQPGTHQLETPVGVIRFELHEGGWVTLENVPSYPVDLDRVITLPSGQSITGDVAYAGNWFFLTEDHGQVLDLSRVEELTAFAWEVRQALAAQGITGPQGEEIDHIELFGPPVHPEAHSRNFVLCPGKAYDRSPCGTGTCAKLACLVARGQLREGELWRQESIVGSIFEGSVRLQEGAIIPRLTGLAHVYAETTLLYHPNDPFRMGIHR